MNWEYPFVEFDDGRNVTVDFQPPLYYNPLT